MVKITTKEKDNVKPRNIPVVLGKYSVICIPRDNRKNVLHVKIENSCLNWQGQKGKKIAKQHSRVLNRYRNVKEKEKDKTWAALLAIGYIAASA